MKTITTQIITTLANSVGDTATASHSYIGMHSAAVVATFVGIFGFLALFVWVRASQKRNRFAVAAAIGFLPVYFGLFWAAGLWGGEETNLDVTAVHEQLTSNGVNISEKALKSMITESSSTFLLTDLGKPETAAVLHNGIAAKLTITTSEGAPSLYENPVWGKKRMNRDVIVTWEVE